jgi:hypothetical protein
MFKDLFAILVAFVHKREDLLPGPPSAGLRGHHRPFLIPVISGYSPVPTALPTEVSSVAPTSEATTMPATEPPTYQPSWLPTSTPPYLPTDIPTCLPTYLPSDLPTNLPTYLPSCFPSFPPTYFPTIVPTPEPTVSPSLKVPTTIPSRIPSGRPTRIPTARPSTVPTIRPTREPSLFKSPPQIINLTAWCLQLPVSSTDGGVSMSITTAALQTYSSMYFYSTPAGSVTFYTPVEGAHTPGSENCRTELRETDVRGKNINWLPTGQSTLSATLAVNAVPTLKPGVKKLIFVDIGQIKGSAAPGSTSNPLAIMQYRYTPSTLMGKVLVQVYLDPAFSVATDYVLATNVPLNQTFAYSMSVGQDTVTGNLFLTLSVNGVTARPILNPSWASNSVYFKAGSYLGDNSTFATGYGQASFYSLTATHTSSIILTS